MFCLFQDTESVKSPETKQNLKSRLSGNTGFIAAKYLEKAKSIDDSPMSPKPLSSVSKQNSLSRSGNLRELGKFDDSNENRAKWGVREMDITTSSSVNKGQINNGNISHSRDSSSDITCSVHSRASSYDVSKSFSAVYIDLPFNGLC